MPSESILISKILLAAPKYSLRLRRNTVGVFQTPHGGHMVSVGLGKGSSDLIGWTTIQSKNGPVAIYTGVEAKAKGTPFTDDQKNYIRLVESMGGIAMCVYSLEEYEEKIDEALQVFRSRVISLNETTG